MQTRLVAITRGVSPGISACELTYLARAPIDLALAQAQHRAYELALAGLGCEIVTIPPDPELSDSVFIEDVAVVLDEIAILTRPGAESRRPEADGVAPALARFRPVSVIDPPGTLDGGDVLRLGRRLFVGKSGRTNDAGIEQLRAVVAPHGYTVTGVAIRGCLHLKSAVTEAATSTVLVNPEWVNPGAFGDVVVIEVDPAEPHAANGLAITGSLVYPTSFPRTRRRLENRGLTVVPVDVSELQKAEGAITCCSLIVSVEESADEAL